MRANEAEGTSVCVVLFQENRSGALDSNSQTRLGWSLVACAWVACGRVQRVLNHGYWLVRTERRFSQHAQVLRATDLGSVVGLDFNLAGEALEH